MSFETYWLLVPSVGTVVALAGCLVLLIMPRAHPNGSEAAAVKPMSPGEIRGRAVAREIFADMREAEEKAAREARQQEQH